MVFELYKELLKEELMLFESTKQMTHFEALNYAFKELSKMDDSNFNKVIIEYREKMRKLFEQNEKINTEIDKIVNEHYNSLIKHL